MTRGRRQRRANGMPRQRARTAIGPLLAGLVMAALAGCGQKGPLVLPDDAAARGPAGAASAGGNDGNPPPAANGARDEDDETESRADGR